MTLTHHDYSPGHPWYYKLGGRALYPKEIKDAVIAAGYKGYRTDIDKANTLPEPKRSEKLRTIRDEVTISLRADLSRYRECARELHRQRESGLDQSEACYCHDIHTSLSLKHNHLYNDFGHLIWLNELLSHQGDLFSF